MLWGRPRERSAMWPPWSRCTVLNNHRFRL